MKPRPAVVVTLLSLSTLIPQLLTCFAQGTAFTYQGRLDDGSGPANGIYDLRLTIYDSSGGAGAVAGPLTNSPVTVTDGLFTVALDFGSGVFSGAERWLEIAVRTNGGAAFATLSPRQQITATPYAITAANVPDYSITADKLAPGAVGSAQLAAGAVQATNIATGAVTTAQLAKPPRSGTIASSSLGSGFDRAGFSVTFSPPFASTPVVTLGVQGSAGTGQAFLNLRNQTAYGFTGQWTPDNLPGPQLVDSALGAGQFNSLAIVNGRPAACYYHSGSGLLRFARAADALGTTWDAPVNVGFASAGGLCLQVVNGKPAACYYDLTLGKLLFVRANDADGTAWGTPLIVDTNGNVGQWNSMAIVNGRPAISYYDADSFDLKYARAANVNGDSWNVPVRVDTNGFVGQYTSLAVVNGNPAISYRDANTFRLSFVRALDADGAAWGNPINPDPGSGGDATSLTVVDGLPAICHYTGSGAQLRYVRATDTNGATWGAPVLVDSGVGLDYTSMRIIGGRPAISYAGLEVRYVRASDATGSAWGSSLYLGAANGAPPASLAEVAGQPAITYFADSSQLKFLRQQSASIPSFNINWIALEP